MFPGSCLFCKEEGLQAVQVCATVVVGAGAGIGLQDVVHDDLAVSETFDTSEYIGSAGIMLLL